LKKAAERTRRLCDASRSGGGRPEIIRRLVKIELKAKKRARYTRSGSRWAGGDEEGANCRQVAKCLLSTEWSTGSGGSLSRGYRIPTTPVSSTLTSPARHHLVVLEVNDEHLDGGACDLLRDVGQLRDPGHRRRDGICDSATNLSTSTINSVHMRFRASRSGLPVGARLAHSCLDGHQISRKHLRQFGSAFGGARGRGSEGR
jgi:hypothetical protein